jgi:hypothetical protein
MVSSVNEGNTTAHFSVKVLQFPSSATAAIINALIPVQLQEI